jgi:hypothetical protein
MNTKTLRCALLIIAAALAGQAGAQAADPPPPNEQVVIPQVDRRDIQKPRFPSNDF